ncbi:class I SAM-dependent methyltransferase, partial [Candidatus Woesearchaeota archaeon]|nr:class I SAM-dependent methyltransferase [Candidatus Woesearchaeota archaeon]
CGSGWLLDRIKKGGAAYVEGCEPSQNNIDLGQKLHPDIIIHKATLESFTPTMQYDLITAVMVFGHIEDLDTAFTKLYSMLKPGGQFHIVTHDYDYNKMKRYKYDVQIEELNEDSYVTMTKRKFGSIADIVRKVKMLKEAAEKAGLTFIEDIPMYPTERLMKTAPHYEASRNVVLTHFLRFKSEKY